MSKFMGLDKWGNFFAIIKQNGGIRASLFKLFRQDELKLGELVGEDKYGNKYYENNYYFYGKPLCIVDDMKFSTRVRRRNRWIEYADKYFLDYDGSQVPAEWYGWLHYKTDLPPFRDPSRPKYSWMLDHDENLSGTPGQYVPYSTTRPKIEAWVPPKKQ